MSNGAKGERFVCVFVLFLYVDAHYMCAHRCVCVWVVGQLTHTEAELYPPVRSPQETCAQQLPLCCSVV